MKISKKIQLWKNLHFSTIGECPSYTYFERKKEIKFDEIPSAQCVLSLAFALASWKNDQVGHDR